MLAATIGSAGEDRQQLGLHGRHHFRQIFDS